MHRITVEKQVNPEQLIGKMSDTADGRERPNGKGTVSQNSANGLS